MSLEFEKYNVKLYQGDCLDNLKLIESESVDAIVTDPPAGISFMGKDWDKDKGGRDDWIAWMTEVMVECRRVLKPNGKMLVWAIPRTAHWTAKAMADSGLYLRGKRYFVFGSGFPKSLNIGKAIDKMKGVEREVVGYEEKLVLETGRGHGRDKAGNVINKGVFVSTGKTHQVPITTPSSEDAKQWDGWGTALKPAVEEWIYATKNEDAEESFGFFYGSKAQGGDRNEGCNELEEKTTEGMRSNAGPAIVGEDRNRTQSKNFHPTVKSTALMTYLCDEVADKESVVLDPFMGSGSTGKACALEERGFIGIEKDEEYFNIAKTRIGYELKKPVQQTLW